VVDGKWVKIAWQSSPVAKKSQLPALLHIRGSNYSQSNYHEKAELSCRKNILGFLPQFSSPSSSPMVTAKRWKYEVIRQSKSLMPISNTGQRKEGNGGEQNVWFHSKKKKKKGSVLFGNSLTYNHHVFNQVQPNESGAYLFN
jgi:hypothetical protein